MQRRERVAGLLGMPCHQQEVDLQGHLGIGARRLLPFEMAEVDGSLRQQRLGFGILSQLDQPRRALGAPRRLDVRQRLTLPPHGGDLLEYLDPGFHPAIGDQGAAVAEHCRRRMARGITRRGKLERHLRRLFEHRQTVTQPRRVAQKIPPGVGHLHRGQTVGAG